MYTVAVSYLEWIRWVATGWFRCADRVVWVDGFEDQQGIDALMDCTPDLQVSDDQGYVIARLKSDALISYRRDGSERSVGHLWLSMVAVSSFHPLSTRGARLLEADAERAAVRLGEPIFEKLWIDWRDRRLEDEAHWRGLSLCAAFGLEVPDLGKVSSQIVDILAGRKLAPNAADVRERAIDGTRALGWASAMSVALIDPAVKTAFTEMPENGEIKTLIKALRGEFDLHRPLLNDEAIKKIAQDIDVILHNLGAKVLPLEPMATVLHYRSLAVGGRELSLDALIGDLVALASSDPNYASLSAYFVGRSMENVAVTTLLYQSNPGGYSALAPVVRQQELNVMALAAARLEAKQLVDPAQKTNPNEAGMAENSDTGGERQVINAATEEVRVKQVLEDQIHTPADSIVSNAGSVEVAATTASPDGDSEAKALTTDSFVDSARPQESVFPTLSEVNRSDEPKKLSAEMKVDMLQQTMEGLEPDVSPNKSRKGRKKSDQAPQGMATGKTSDTKSSK